MDKEIINETEEKVFDYKALRNALIGVFIILLMFIIVLMGNNSSLITITDKCNDIDLELIYDGDINKWKTKHVSLCEKYNNNAYTYISGILKNEEEISKYVYNPKVPSNLETYFGSLTFKVDKEYVCENEDNLTLVIDANFEEEKTSYNVNIKVSGCN